jgi:hypothetical protein
MHMKQRTVWLALVVALSPCLAAAKDVCILHEDDGEMLVLKGIARGSKPVSGYVVEFLGGSSFGFTPLAGSALMEADGRLSVGVTQYHVGTTGFAENISFHRVTCNPGANGKLDALDRCTNTEKNTDHLPEQDSHASHIIPCNEIPAKP